MDSEICPERNAITRRKFCNSLVLTSTALAFAAKKTHAQDVKQLGVLLAYPPLKIEGAESVMPGSFLYFSYPTTKYAAVLLRTQDGQYFAYARKCAHRGCSVDFNGARRCLTCPCHQGAYDARTGFVLFGPPPRPLDPIVLQMRAGGQVWAVGKTIGNNNPNA
jgi:Rieske Fe-S protein